MQAFCALAAPLFSGRRLAAAQHVDEFAAHSFLVHQFVAGLLGKGLEVAQRACIGGHHFQQLTTVHARQLFFGFEDGQGAIHAPGVDFLVNLHGALAKLAACRTVPLLGHCKKQALPLSPAPLPASQRGAARPMGRGRRHPSCGGS